MVEGRVRVRRVVPNLMAIRWAGSSLGMSTPPTKDPLETAADEWPQVNRDAIVASNAWLEEHGLPLHDHRLF
ncbi:type II toxin-antitoxin system CcdA family antitoxin [Erythrobacter sp. W302b]|uniref:type II toxin-antitoxin system CcdA family antitoxin n=1 Tax=Erythrobacter sp. W302b TaxID=3389874 RepID=UPI00396B1579